MHWWAPVPEIGEEPSTWGDLMVMTATILGEAEGEPPMGKLGVAYVIKNRVADERWPNTASGVCLQHLQFSCWNPGSLRLISMTNPRRHVSESTWNDCFRAALNAEWGLEPDPTLGANSYLAAASLKVLPIWAEQEKMTVRIGAHSFFKL